MFLPERIVPKSYPSHANHHHLRAAAAFALLSIAPAAVAAPAPTDKYHVTDEEKAACTTDAISWCSDTYPDEDKLLACMKTNRRALSANCQAVFAAGLKRRHLEGR